MQFKESGQQIKLKEYPRMADFAEIAEIISRTMGEKEGRFMQVYFDNIRLQTEEAIQANPVGEAIVYFVNTFETRGINDWIGSSSQLLSELEDIAHNLRINTSSKSWPKGANSLSRRLKEVKTNLRQLGILIEKDKDSKTSARTLNIRKISPESPESPESQIHAQNEGKITGDTLDDILDGKSNIAGKNSEIHAQNNSSGDTGGLDDISGTLVVGVEGNNNTNTKYADELLEELKFFSMFPNTVEQELDERIAYEKSPFKSIIKRKGNFYYCILHPQVQSVHLEEIERHCQLKEIELHKSKVLEFEKSSANENED